MFTALYRVKTVISFMTRYLLSLVYKNYRNNNNIIMEFATAVSESSRVTNINDNAKQRDRMLMRRNFLFHATQFQILVGNRMPGTINGVLVKTQESRRGH